MRCTTGSTLPETDVIDSSVPFWVLRQVGAAGVLISVKRERKGIPSPRFSPVSRAR
jgi:hypothetical protein